MNGHHIEQTGHQTAVWLPILHVFSWTEKLYFPCPGSRLRIWSRETGSAFLSRVSPLIFQTQAESG